MPLFFFNIEVGSRSVVDVEGIELESALVAHREGASVLPEIARDARSMQPEIVVLTVLDEAGNTVFSGTCTTGSAQPKERP